MICRIQRIYIDENWLFSCIFLLLFHKNTPVSSIIQKTGVNWKFFDRLKKRDADASLFYLH